MKLTELLAQIEPVHREVIAEHRARHVHDHRVAPVRFRDVEPEMLQALDEARRRLRHQPERVNRRRVLERAGARGVAPW